MRMAALKSRNRHGQRGNAVVELAFTVPWLYFLFAGAFDWGVYSYALISAECAAREAVMQTSSSSLAANDAATACALALDQFRSLPNVGTSVTTCEPGGPVEVSADAVTGPDGAAASRVSVTYRTISLPPIPGLLQGQTIIRRTLQMRVRG